MLTQWRRPTRQGAGAPDPHRAPVIAVGLDSAAAENGPSRTSMGACRKATPHKPSSDAASDTDLLVVGSRGSGFKTMLFGSATSSVMEDATSEAIVVHPRKRTAPDQDEQAATADPGVVENGPRMNGSHGPKNEPRRAVQGDARERRLCRFIATVLPDNSENATPFLTRWGNGTSVP